MFSAKLISAGVIVMLVWPLAGAKTKSAHFQDERIEVRATDTLQLKTLLEGQKVEALLTDGTALKGKVKSVIDLEIRLEVKSSNGPTALSRGENSLPTSRFATFTITKFKGKKRGILAATLGFAGLGVGILVIASEVTGESWNGTDAAILTAAVATGAIGGYSLGRHLDRKRVTVVIR